MEFTRISGYDQYILLSQQTRNIGSNVQAYASFVKVMSFLEKCSKSDSKVVNFDDKIIEKPLTQQEAQRALENIKKIKWDNTVMGVAKFMKLELR